MYQVTLVDRDQKPVKTFKSFKTELGALLAGRQAIKHLKLHGKFTLLVTPEESDDHVRAC